MPQPRLEEIFRPAIDDALGRDAGERRVCNGVVGVGEFAHTVRVTVEREGASGGQGPTDERMVEVLACGLAVDLHRDAGRGGLGEDSIPVRHHPRTCAALPPARMRRMCTPRVRTVGRRRAVWSVVTLS
jgi:hypothetical protein